MKTPQGEESIEAQKKIKRKEVYISLRDSGLKQPPLAVIMCMKIFVFCQERKEEVS